MNKINGTTPNLTEKNIDKIAELFPEMVTEMERDDGMPTRSIDFDLLRQALSDSLVEGGDERYRLDWPGKRASLLKANTPIAKTLRPDKASSVDFDTTQNLFIEGDNFEALKILQESYLGKVKMIYIDPPYNTGKDFVYSDNFTQDKAEYDEEIEAVDEEGNKMFRENTRTNPRFHSDWLSMMYERLIIARDLLREDGVIFISIDDNEVHNLRKVCDEIFGESNFVSNLVWQSRTSISNDDEVSMNHNHTLIYSKNREKLTFGGEIIDETEYDNSDNDPRGAWKLVPLDANKPGGNTQYEILNPKTQVKYLPPNGRSWAINPSDYKKLFDDGRIKFGKNDDSAPKRKLFLKERLEKGDTKTPSSLLLDAGTTKDGTKATMELFEGKKVFDYPKPPSLISRLISYAAVQDGDLIVDFFAGSATTAHALMEYNTINNSSISYILVQYAEDLVKSLEKAKGQAEITLVNAIKCLESINKPLLLTELGKERIRRVAAKIKTDYADKLAERESPIDTGFRAYTVADTAFLDVERHPSELEQGQLLELANNIKGDRTPEDLLTQVMLELGLTLDLPIETKQVGANTIFYVAGNALVACFDESIPTTLIDEMAKCQPLQVAFKDASFGSDDALINAETHIKRLSPDTILSVI